MDTFVQHLVQGTTVGATYALVALGFSMQFAAMRLVNFAHGESFMLGAFAALALIAGGSMPYAVAFCLAVVLMSLAGALVERLAVRPLYASSEMNLFIATIGLSIILRQVGLLVFGAEAKPFPTGFASSTASVGAITITYQQITTLGVTMVMMIGLEWLMRRTRLGIAMRAVAQDETTASLMGVNTLRIKSLVYGLSTGLGAAAGIMFASLTFAVFDMGLLMGIKGFTAAVVGGLGSLPGALLGGLLLGLVEQMASGYLSSLYRDAISMSVLIVVLLLMPNGLVGLRGAGWGKV